jgi:uncharacterized protein
MKILRISILLLIWVLPRGVAGQIPDRPVPPRLVNDLAGILDVSQQQSIEELLVQFDQSTGTQITVVTVASLDGYDKADYAFRIGEQWGVGQKGKNNGVVVLVKPKTQGEAGQVYIAVGYGLEGVIPDAVANRLIVNQEMIPRFRENDYYGGILNGVNVIMDLARGEFSAQQYADKSGNSSASGGGRGVFILLLILFLVIFPLMRKGKQVHSSGSRNLPWWMLLGMMSSGGKHRGGWNDFSSGRGSFGGGGFGRGGFGGFGGGSFGGGGAGGSW